MALIMIYFFKNIISINDVTKLLTPLFDSYFHNEELSLESIINSFLDYIKTCNLQDSILKEFDDSKKIFENTQVDDKDYLETLGLITMLSYDTFVKKMLIEKLVDSLPDVDKKE